MLVNHGCVGIYRLFRQIIGRHRIRNKIIAVTEEVDSGLLVINHRRIRQKIIAVIEEVDRGLYVRL
jgi:hypothetical protein